VLGYFGTLNEYYDFGPLLAGLGALKQEGYKVRLDMYGDGPMRNHVLELASKAGLQEEINLRDIVPRNEVPRKYRSITATVIPYSEKLKKGVSLKSIEAMALQVPVVISKRSDPLYVNEDNCIVLEHGSADEWQVAIRETMNHELRERLVSGGARTARRFQWSAVAGLVWQTIDSLDQRERQA